MEISLNVMNTVVGVTAGRCRVGNISNYDQRSFVVIGNLSSRSKSLCQWAKSRKIRFCIDQGMAHQVNSTHCIHLVDKVQVFNDKFEVYEIWKKRTHNKEQEWMYELDESRKNEGKAGESIISCNNIMKVLFDKLSVEQLDRLEEIVGLLPLERRMSIKTFVFLCRRLLSIPHHSYINQLTFNPEHTRTITVEDVND
eukprot:NODE_3376_length_1363_cov_23.509677_g2939_i0.p1 GENE.NODE_3376_length_1363_cov_23.509677_g2939_i0~~NODE_3376_length_1363_cov_23.509677_g2939_i0.p1  ORF type:complete len:197 (-),score=25.90 NODE_3376_length_1363_cov_23.509677_g2939_i0:404-994(-)